MPCQLYSRCVDLNFTKVKSQGNNSSPESLPLCPSIIFFKKAKKKTFISVCHKTTSVIVALRLTLNECVGSIDLNWPKSHRAAQAYCGKGKAEASQDEIIFFYFRQRCSLLLTCLSRSDRQMRSEEVNVTEGRQSVRNTGMEAIHTCVNTHTNKQAE